jgi:hypothetical protein
MAERDSPATFAIAERVESVVGDDEKRDLRSTCRSSIVIDHFGAIPKVGVGTVGHVRSASLHDLAEGADR